MINSTVLRVRFSIECHVTYCGTGYRGGKRNSKVILSNRWSVAEQLDSAFFTTRTINGTLRLARAINTDELGHYHKPTVIPPLEDGFRRDRIEYSVEPNGLTCTYTVTDKQVHAAAPPPGAKMDIIHKESAVNQSAFFSDVSIRIEGGPLPTNLKCCDTSSSLV